METTISQINASEIIIFFIFYVVITAAMIVLEIFLARKSNKLYGFIPPAITFLPTVPYLLISVSSSSIGFSISSLLAFIVLLILINFNTLILLLIYKLIRKHSVK